MRYTLSLLALSTALACSGERKVHFETTAADRGPIVAKVTASGTLSALVTVQVGSQVSGRIREILVDFNSVVTKGQVIARIDPQLFDAALEQARANYVAAKGELTKAQVQAVDAERQGERAAGLFDRRLIAEADRDTAQAGAAVARAQVEAASGRVAQALAALHQAEVNLTYTTIVSPIDGIVISRNVDVGQTVAASLQAPTLFAIAEDLRKMQVNTSVAEADIGKLRAGMPTTFTVDAFPGKRFAGTVRQIRNAPQMVQNVVTYDAVIDVPNPELELRPGMTATVTFVQAEKEEALRVPNAALRFRPPPDLFPERHGPGDGQIRGKQATKGRGPSGPNDGRTVWLLRDGAPTPVHITTGISDGSLTEVTGGELTAGDLLITDAMGSRVGSPGSMPFGRH